MKSSLLLSLLLAYSLNLAAQWTDDETNLTTTYNVGIGTDSPNSKLQISSDSWQFQLSNSNGGSDWRIGSTGSGWTSGAGKFLITNTGSSGNASITIDSQQRVGIGTTTPTEKLQIGSAFSFHDGGHEVLGFGCSASGNADLDPNGYASEIRLDPSTGNFRFATSSSLTSFPQTRLTIKSNGYVGIGTSSPDENLTVVGDVNVGGTGNGQVKARHINGKDHLSTSYGNLYLNYHTTAPVYVGTNASNSNLFVYGGVGIGTTSTGSHKLAVEGSIGAREVKVEASGWSDFVFEEDYDLRTLEEVEAHIAENGHLPEIPSEAEVAAEGINLGEMDAKLLQKIEELTLYMIDLNQRVSQLEQENHALKENNEKLQQLLKGSAADRDNK